MVAAVRVHKTGGPEVLTYEDIDVSAPGPGQIKIKNHACGVNFIDTYFRMGMYPAPAGLPFVWQRPAEKPKSASVSRNNASGWRPFCSATAYPGFSSTSFPESICTRSTGSRYTLEPSAVRSSGVSSAACGSPCSRSS